MVLDALARFLRTYSNLLGSSPPAALNAGFAPIPAVRETAIEPQGRTLPAVRPNPRRDANNGHLSVAHSITSSARTRVDCGTVRPSALAVLRLMANSKRVGPSIGNSPGAAPRKMRAT